MVSRVTWVEWDLKDLKVLKDPEDARYNTVQHSAEQ